MNQKQQIGKVLSGGSTTGAKLADKVKEMLGMQDDYEARVQKRVQANKRAKEAKSTLSFTLPTERE